MSLTPNQFADQLREQMRLIQTQNRPLQVAAYSALSNMDERIFDQGLDAAEGSIGQYDTKDPMYVNPKTVGVGATSQRNKDTGFKTEGLLPPKGKHGDTHFKNGKPHVTTYVNNYKDLKNRVGRRIDRVNFVFTGELRLDMQNPVNNIPTPERINTHEYRVSLKRDSSVEKRKALESKYGVVFKHSEKEKDEFFDILEKELALIFTP